jgi:hypothetical protein
MAFSLIAGMTPDVAKEHIETFGDDIANAVEADRDWFRKHPGRKWRVRAVAFGEFPNEMLACKCGWCRRVVVVNKVAPKVRIRRVRTIEATSTLPATDAAIKARFGEVP